MQLSNLLKHGVVIARRAGLAGLAGLALAGSLCVPAFAQDVSSSIVAGDFSTLKAALENPERDTEVVVPGGTYVFSDTVTINKDLVLKNAEGQTVTFELGMFNEDSGSLGKTMMDVTAGSVTFAGENNESLVFDGKNNLPAFDHSKDQVLNHATPIVTNVTNNGVFLTLQPTTQATIEHATFKNASNGGALTGAIFVKRAAQLTMNDGLLTHNYLTHQETISNNSYFRNANTRGARSATIGLYGGTFVMNGGAIVDNMNGFDTGAAIGAAGDATKGVTRAKITINSGSISNNSVHSYEGDFGGAGGAIYAGVNTDTVINSGTFDNNYANGAGGFMVSDWGTNLEINGGTFSNNKAVVAGGVLCAYDQFMKNDPENQGNIIGKPNDYGVTDINVWYNTYHLGTKVTVNGGTFAGNQSYMGGAIYLGCDNAEINAGTFTNNQANRFGGAIYLSTDPYRLTIRNAYVADNIADDNSIKLGSDFYPDLNPGYFHTGSGGGIWYCPTGSGTVSVSNGLTVVGNSATEEGADFASMRKDSGKDFKVSLTNRMLGGGYIVWQDDKQGARATEDTPERTELTDQAENLMLKANSSERAQATAKALATTIFTNNKAKRGGAIATNGHVDFGDANLAYNLKITKHWDALIGDADKKEATAELYIVTKDTSGAETENFVDSVKLNAENDFTAKFENLPLESNGRATYRVKEAGDTWDVEYTTAINDADPAEGNTFSTADLVNGDTVTVAMTNHPKFNATFEYRSATEGKELTPEILAQLPSDQHALSIGTKVDATQPETPVFELKEGTWTFEGWDFDAQTIKDSDVHFIGLWKFVPAPEPETPDPETPEPETPEPTTPTNPTTPAPEPQAKPKPAPKVTPKTSDAALAAPVLAILAAAGIGLVVAARKMRRN